MKNESMKTRLFLFGVLCIAAAHVLAAPLKIVKVNAPAINCLFSSNCTVTVNDAVASFTTNLPPFTAGSTNASLSAFLQSRAYQGQPGTPEAGLTAYEYRLVLKKLTGAKSFSINSMTLNFSPYSNFNYQGQTNNQAWAITSGGLGSVGPASAYATNSMVTFTFNPPVKLTSTSSQETSTYFFGMLSSHPVPNTLNSWAAFTGSEQSSSGSSIPINYLMLQVRTP